jgi:hypothetical protein
MADSISLDVLIDDLFDAEYAQCQFPERDRNDKYFASADFRDAYGTSPITGAGFKVTPLGMPLPGQPGERFKHGRIAGYRVEANIPACLNGHNRFLVNGVPEAARAAVRLLKVWLAQNGCTADGLAMIKEMNASLCSVTLTFLYEFNTPEQAREALAQFRTHSEAILNKAKANPKSKPPAYSYPPKPKTDKEPYTYTSYVAQRTFKIAAYVKERDQPNSFLLPIQDKDIENHIQGQSERTLRVEVTVHGKWLKDNKLSRIADWIGNEEAYKEVFSLVRSTLRLDDDLRTKRMKKTTVDGLKLSKRDKKYLMDHLNGMDVFLEHPDIQMMDQRQWSKTYSAARKNIMLATSRIDLNIRYVDQVERLSPAIARTLAFQEEYKPPAGWAEHVFSRDSSPTLQPMLDRYVDLWLSGRDELPSGPVRDLWR